MQFFCPLRRGGVDSTLNCGAGEQGKEPWHGPWMTTILEKYTLHEAFLCSLRIMTRHMHPTLACYHTFDAQLYITACISSSPQKWCVSVQ